MTSVLLHLRVTMSPAYVEVADLALLTTMLAAMHRYLPWSSYKTLRMVKLLVTCTQEKRQTRVEDRHCSMHATSTTCYTS